MSASQHRATPLAESHHIQVLRADLAASGVRLERDLLAVRAGDKDAQAMRADSLQRFEQAIDRCAGCHHAPGVDQQLAAVRRTFDAYVVTTRENQNPPKMAIASVANDAEASAIAQLLVDQTTKMADLSYNHLRARGDDVGESIEGAWRTLCGTMTLTVLFGGVVALHLRRRMTRPLEALLADIKRMRDAAVVAARSDANSAARRVYRRIQKFSSLSTWRRR
ncbi:MAG: hypothetical protein H6817_04060 [Phycisphaerales bacterium]|nr:hypothetical protein [Phycisphaerales bacterium]